MRKIEGVPVRLKPNDGERQRATDKVPAQPRRRSLMPLAAAFGGAVILGVGITAVVFGGSKGHAPVPAVAVPLVTVKPPAVAEPPEPVAVAVAEPPVVDEDEPQPIEPTPPKASPKPAATAVAPKAKRVAKTPAPTAAAPAEDNEAIPPGQGQLRISTLPANVATHVTVGRDDWGQPPQNRHLASGRYAVTVLLPGGKKSPEWHGAVMPDATTVLIYDIDSGRWQKR